MKIPSLVVVVPGNVTKLTSGGRESARCINNSTQVVLPPLQEKFQMTGGSNQVQIVFLLSFMVRMREKLDL